MNGRNENFSAVKPNAVAVKATPAALKSSAAVMSRANDTGALNNARRIAPLSPSKGNSSKLKKTQAKEPVKYIVKYITKQIYICPTQPILIVERLPHLEYHVNELTKSIGRRPLLYHQGKSVQLIPESREEHVTIQSYLAQLEAEEGIIWCSRSLPPGNGLKVNIVERVVKVVKIAEDIDSNIMV